MTLLIPPRPMSSSVSSILVVEPHPILCDGIACVVLRSIPDVKVLGCPDFSNAADLIRQQHVHLVITDFNIGDQNATEILRTITADDIPTKCLILSSQDALQIGYACIRAGASGFIEKSAPVARIIDAIRLVLDGHHYLSERLSRAIINGHQPAPPNSPSKRLTARELQIFTLLGQCHSVSSIAGKLGVSVKTVEAHREHIKNKLGHHNAAEVIAAAARWLDDTSFSI